MMSVSAHRATDLPRRNWGPWQLQGAVTALFAHPGHELFILTLLSDCGATINCVSDGSGGAAADRSAISRDLMSACGCSLGPVHAEIVRKERQHDHGLDRLEDLYAQILSN
ncbi:hypothetical protein [Pseudohoeflea coraliihabitans]|uniref:Uncharacterized protein n=1 Tax=Pseudohoeflea coraliihabitans TaxID=2860393 RepID=A0ABS6WNR8_9HYPH|nr:hypothetical protein [Pseudohoeflea sp. DP4N28-3]MBW3096719.1 hypothetical protein [Pseudohoeflea sp. DP4N28-3]